MIPGARSATGSLQITVAPLGADAVYVGGFAMKPSGVLYVTDGADPDLFVGGVGVSKSGVLCLDSGGSIARFVNGLPITSDGRLLFTLSQPPVASDSYVGGTRVGASGVYVDNIT